MDAISPEMFKLIIKAIDAVGATEENFLEGNTDTTILDNVLEECNNTPECPENVKQLVSSARNLVSKFFSISPALQLSNQDEEALRTIFVHVFDLIKHAKEKIMEAYSITPN